MFCLDTYALAEIGNGNPKFSEFLNKEFIITDLTMAEYYSVLYRDGKEDKAIYWHNRLSSFCKSVSREILIKALKYRIDNKKEDLSIFDCMGYIYALENNLKFVTGDKEFKNKEGVMFIQK